MYYRVQRLPDGERNKFRAFYKTFIGDEALREDLGECYIQASEFCSCSQYRNDFPAILKEYLEKVQFFYSQDDPRRHIIDKYLSAAQMNPTLCDKQYLDKFFLDELQQFIEVSVFGIFLFTWQPLISTTFFLYSRS